jgi:anti-anti-sigma regulatory factor
MERSRSTARLRVRRGLGDARRPITLIAFEGEHDGETRAALISALDGVDGHLVVDLTLCGFVDTVVIGALLGKALELGKGGHRLELVVPPSGPLARTVDVLGLQDVVWARQEPLDRGARDGY